MFKQVKIVFGVSVSTEDSDFVLDGDCICPQKGKHPKSGMFDGEHFLLLLHHDWSAIALLFLITEPWI